MAESFRKQGINRLQKFKAIRRKDHVEDSSASKFYVNMKSDPDTDGASEPLGAVVKKTTSPPVVNVGNARHSSSQHPAGFDSGAKCVTKRPPCETSADITATNSDHPQTGRDETLYLDPDAGTSKPAKFSIGSNPHLYVHQNGDIHRLDTSTTKPRSNSYAPHMVIRDTSYEQSLNSHDLSGRASLSARDLVFGIPPPPVRPPRVSSLAVEIPLQKSSSTPDIGSKSDATKMEQPARPIPVDILRVMDTLKTMAPSDDEGTESDTEDSYIAWSDDDDRSITSSTSSGTDNIYENMVSSQIVFISVWK
jgi:hypothetical protein